MASLHPDLFFPPLEPSPAAPPPTTSKETPKPSVDVYKPQWIVEEKGETRSILPMYTVPSPPPASSPSSSSNGYRTLSILLFASLLSLLLYLSRGTSIDFSVSWTVQPIPKAMRNEVPWYKIAVVSLDVEVDVTTAGPTPAEERRRPGMEKVKVTQLEITASSYPLAVNKRKDNGVRKTVAPLRKQLGYATLVKQAKQIPAELVKESSPAGLHMEETPDARDSAPVGAHDLESDEEERAAFQHEPLMIQS
ncbi:hypothetical protein FRB96_008793 [Tulasnella sp. 330]|nr:hypothetical protein FRB96_008793 [Tulasnella sp. 330]KAG8884149.1 hypothetical protein FRB97_005132 [Tulasnella sp. 331]KAG8890175.1 hypothetical protein FRB98_000503 [Tulasnella sp. 332]